MVSSWWNFIVNRYNCIFDMKTYAEANGEKPFNWNEFLNKEHITQTEWHEAEELSADWVTCACGNQCETIPRNHVGTPDDYTLDVLGSDFSVAIHNKNLVMAKIVLAKIEKRSAELLKEL